MKKIGIGGRINVSILLFSLLIAASFTPVVRSQDVCPCAALASLEVRGTWVDDANGYTAETGFSLTIDQDLLTAFGKSAGQELEFDLPFFANLGSVFVTNVGEPTLTETAKIKSLRLVPAGAGRVYLETRLSSDGFFDESSVTLRVYFDAAGIAPASIKTVGQLQRLFATPVVSATASVSDEDQDLVRNTIEFSTLSSDAEPEQKPTLILDYEVEREEIPDELQDWENATGIDAVLEFGEDIRFRFYRGVTLVTGVNVSMEVKSRGDSPRVVRTSSTMYFTVREGGLKGYFVGIDDAPGVLRPSVLVGTVSLPIDPAVEKLETQQDFCRLINGFRAGGMRLVSRGVDVTNFIDDTDTKVLPCAYRKDVASLSFDVTERPNRRGYYSISWDDLPASFRQEAGSFDNVELYKSGFVKSAGDFGGRLIFPARTGTFCLQAQRALDLPRAVTSQFDPELAIRTVKAPCDILRFGEANLVVNSTERVYALGSGVRAMPPSIVVTDEISIYTRASMLILESCLNEVVFP